MINIATNNPLKLSDKFFEFKLDDINIKIDLTILFKEKVDSKDAYINITSFFKSKYCRFDSFEKWYRNAEIQRYIQGKNRRFLNNPNLGYLENIEKIYKKSLWFDKDWLETPTPLIISRKGKYGGTWLHYEIFLKFLTSLDVEMEIEVYDIMQKLISEVHIMKISRENTKFLFHPLTDIIKDVWIPAQKSENSKKWAYSMLLDLANLKALGITSKQYKENNNISAEQIKEDNNISIRDYMSKDELAKIESAEQDIWGLIKYAKILNYADLKKSLIPES